jgi:hypothetical protein
MKSQTELKDLYNYDPETGILTSIRWGKPVGSRRDDGLRTRLGRVHRIIWVWMTGDDLGADVIDHINGDPCDNRWFNLRRCSRAQNQMNRGLNANNTSGYKGVTWVPRTNLWQAAIGFDGVIHYLGQYETADEAYDVYLEEAERCFGIYNRDTENRVS